jgi:hypothetical protein
MTEEDMLDTVAERLLSAVTVQVGKEEYTDNESTR